MSSSAFTQRSGIAIVACLILAGCSSEDSVILRVPNKPPFIDPDSFKWEPNDMGGVRLNKPYTYSVRAIDPDIGDTVVRYDWSVDDGSGSQSLGSTEQPSIEHRFRRTFTDEHNEAFNTVTVRAVDQKGAIGSDTTFIVPISLDNNPPQLLIEVSVVQGLTLYLNFTITDFDDDNVTWTINWGDDKPVESGVVNRPSDGISVGKDHTYSADLEGQAISVSITVDDGKGLPSSTDVRIISITL